MSTGQARLPFMVLGRSDEVYFERSVYGFEVSLLAWLDLNRESALHVGLLSLSPSVMIYAHLGHDVSEA